MFCDVRATFMSKALVKHAFANNVLTIVTLEYKIIKNNDIMEK